jgi:imidazolonepropionase-like amidohydrolase
MSGGDMREAVKAAHDLGLAVMVHANGAAAVERALEAGADSVEHGYWADPSGGTAELFARTGAVWTPTRAAVHNLIRAGAYGAGVLQAVLAAQAEQLKIACARGALIASGSDSGAFAVAQGDGTRDEYRLLGLLGIDPKAGNERVAAVFRRA